MFFLSQNNGKCGYNVGDKLDSNPGDNIQEFRQLPMVIINSDSITKQGGSTVVRSKLEQIL